MSSDQPLILRNFIYFVTKGTILAYKMEQNNLHNKFMVLDSMGRPQGTRQNLVAFNINWIAPQ